MVVDPLRVRTGSVANGEFDVDAIVRWILESLEPFRPTELRNIELLDSNGGTIASYRDVFLSSIGLFDPVRTMGPGRADQLPTIRVGFDLVMQPSRP